MHVEVSLGAAPSAMHLVLKVGLVLVVAVVRWGRVLEWRVGLRRQPLRRHLREKVQDLMRPKYDRVS